MPSDTFRQSGELLCDLVLGHPDSAMRVAVCHCSCLSLIDGTNSPLTPHYFTPRAVMGP